RPERPEPEAGEARVKRGRRGGKQRERGEHREGRSATAEQQMKPASTAPVMAAQENIPQPMVMPQAAPAVIPEPAPVTITPVENPVMPVPTPARREPAAQAKAILESYDIGEADELVQIETQAEKLKRMEQQTEAVPQPRPARPRPAPVLNEEEPLQQVETHK
ncbi:MAG: hypothetical protein ACREUV_04030, partial [Burkholderiales bacterium]